MTTNALASLKHDALTAKRAQYEGFEFTIPSAGLVVVTNASYGDEKDEHTYTVTVEAGVPTECTCPADEHLPGACKHRVAVAIRGPIMEAAAGAPARADGGMVVEPHPEGSEPETTHAPGCDNPECEGYEAAGRPLLSWECWEEWA